MKSDAHILSILAGLLLPAAAAAAQVPTSDDSARVQLPPVTVTATRQSTPLFTVPLAVTMIGKRQLENKRGYSLDDALSNVPGVFAQSRYGASDIRLTIRGFGARGAGDRSNAGTSRGIRVLIDGIPETEPDGRTAFDMVDLAAVSGIEVVRSNASALWGNAGGGVIGITTVPDFDGSFASIQQMAGRYGFLRTAVRGGVNLGPAVLAVTFTNTTQEGYRAHSDSRRFLVNATLTSRLGSATELGVFTAAVNDLFHVPGPLTMAQATSDPRSANATYAARDERRYDRIGRIGVSLRHSLTDATSVSGMVFVNPKVLQRSERGTFRDFNRYHLGGNLIYRAAYDLKPGVTASTVVGADRAYQDGSILFYSLTSAGTRGTELRDNKGEGALNTGIFAQQQFVFGVLALDLGARWDEIRYDYRSFIEPGLDEAPVVVPDLIPARSEVESEHAEHELLLGEDPRVERALALIVAKLSAARPGAGERVEKNAAILISAVGADNGARSNSGLQIVRRAINEITAEMISIEVAESPTLGTLEHLRIYKHHS